MRLHEDGDHPQDVAQRVRDVVWFLYVAVAEGNPSANMLEGQARGGLASILLAVENSVTYVERAWAAKA